MSAHSRRASRPAKSVVLTRERYRALVERIEDLEDTLRLREAIASTRLEDCLPIELVKRELAGEHPLRVWREHRGLTMKALSRKSGIPQGYVSEIETRKKPGSVAAYRALANALGVAVDDLIR